MPAQVPETAHAEDLAIVPAHAAAVEVDREASRIAVLACVVVALALAAIPILLVERLPLHDYPNHVARAHILAHWTEFPALHRFYERGDFLVPNIGLDVAAFALARLVSIDSAARLFTFLGMALCLTGTVALAHAVQRRRTLWPCAAALFVYNGILMWGFLNYLVGVGVMLWGVTLWMRLRERPVIVRIAAGTVLSLVTFFCHLAAFGLYALAIAGYELERAWRARAPWTRTLADLAAGALQFGPALAIFVLGSSTAQGSSMGLHTHSLLEKLALAPAVVGTASPVVDGLTAGVLGALAGWMLGRGARLHLAPSMRWTAAIFLVAYLLLPFGIFGTWYLDVRLPIAFLFVAFAAVEVRRVSARTAAIAASVCALLLIARTVVISREWLGFGRRADAIVAALDVVPAGATLFTSYVARDGSFAERLSRWRPPLPFVASYASLTRQAFAVPIFADRRHQPLVLKPEFQREHEFQNALVDVPPTREQLAEVTRELQELHFAPDAPPPSPLYLLLLADDVGAAMPPAAALMSRGPGYSIYAIAPPTGPRTAARD